MYHALFTLQITHIGNHPGLMVIMPITTRSKDSRKKEKPYLMPRKVSLNKYLQNKHTHEYLKSQTYQKKHNKKKANNSKDPMATNFHKPKNKCPCSLCLCSTKN